VNGKVMIAGLGSLGNTLLQQLAREPAVAQVVAGSRDRLRGQMRCNLARVAAMAQGFLPHVSFTPLDLEEPERVAAILSEQSPDVVVCTASMQTWWLTELLPAEASRALNRAGFGAWLPVHLALAINFMEAVRLAGYRGHTLVASFPDVVNVVLSRMGLTPTCGIGNLDEIVPKLRHLAGGRLGVSPRDVSVYLVAHHALEPFVFGAPDRPAPPFWLRIECRGEDVSERVNGGELLFASYPLPPGPEWHFLTAGSAVRLIRALLGRRDHLHVPAPFGLPGGYPAAASRDGIELLDLPGLTREQAIAINQRSHAYDGVEEVEQDGTVRFTEETRQVMNRVLGYNVGRLRPADSPACARELIALFRQYAARHGVDLTTVR
jgi:NAD(P)-dependent dehydrogenase (short-subunit alcohol dehydrogenase family)